MHHLWGEEKTRESGQKHINRTKTGEILKVGGSEVFSEIGGMSTYFENRGKLKILSE